MAVEVDGRRVEHDFPGRQGRVLFVYLAANRLRAVDRDELLHVLWGEHLPAEADGALRVLLSKLRRVLGPEALPGGGTVRLRLPPDAWVDLEAARDAIHRAESALALGEWERSWGAAQVALFVSRRGFLPGEEAAWIDEVRRELDHLYERALEAYGRASLEIGGTELAAAERCGRELVARSPYRESGHGLLMASLVKAGNSAEALRVYEELRRLLRTELGISPSPAMRALHASLPARPLGRGVVPRRRANWRHRLSLWLSRLRREPGTSSSPPGRAAASARASPRSSRCSPSPG